MESPVHAITAQFVESAPVSVAEMTDLILSREWGLTAREMPGGDVLVRVSLIGKPSPVGSMFVERAEHYHTALTAALKRALQSTGEYVE